MLFTVLTPSGFEQCHPFLMKHSSAWLRLVMWGQFADSQLSCTNPPSWGISSFVHRWYPFTRRELAEYLNPEGYMPTNAARIAETEYGAPSGVRDGSSPAKMTAALAFPCHLTFSRAIRYSPSSLLIHNETFQWFQFLCPLYVVICALFVVGLCATSLTRSRGVSTGTIITVQGLFIFTRRKAVQDQPIGPSKTR